MTAGAVGLVPHRLLPILLAAAALGCSGSGPSPTEPSPRRVVLQGSVVAVSTQPPSLLVLSQPGATAWDLEIGPGVSFAASPVADFAALGAAYGAGSGVAIEASGLEDAVSAPLHLLHTESIRAEAVEVPQGSTTLPLSQAPLPPFPSLIGAGRSKVYFSPWTIFEPDSQYGDFGEALTAIAAGESLWIGFEFAQVAPQHMHALRLRICRGESPGLNAPCG